MQNDKNLIETLERDPEVWKKYLEIVGEIVVVIDPEGRVVFINKKGAELAGYKQREVIGKNWFNTFLAAAERVKVRDKFNKLMKGEIRPAEYGVNSIITKNRKRRIISWHNTVLKNRTGQITATLSAGEDITQKKKADEQLQESELRYRNLFENALEGIFQASLDGRFITVNPAYAQMLGFSSPEEMLAEIKNVTQIYVNPEDRKRMLNTIVEKGSIQDYEIRFTNRKGRNIWVSIKARAVKDSKGKISYYEGMVENITKRKEAEEEAQKSFAHLRTAMEGSIHAVAMAVEAKDPYTAGHQQHVAELSRAIARDLELPEDKVEGIYLAGMIHDLGKISVPSEFLAKPGKLTEFEYSLIKTHPEAGYRIIENVEFPWPVATIILQHHERIDGSGYPMRLKGDQILFETRIISVADVVEAMTFHRPYRPAFGLRLALNEVESNADVLYDREVVNSCVSLFKNEKFTWNGTGPFQ